MDSGKQGKQENTNQAGAINVLLFRVGENPSIQEISNTVTSYQESVGGNYRPFLGRGRRPSRRL